MFIGRDFAVRKRFPVFERPVSYMRSDSWFAPGRTTLVEFERRDYAPEEDVLRLRDLRDSSSSGSRVGFDRSLQRFDDMIKADRGYGVVLDSVDYGKPALLSESLKVERALPLRDAVEGYQRKEWMARVMKENDEVDKA